MLDNLKITEKFPLVMISFGLVSALVSGIISYQRASDELEKVAQDKLFSLLESRKSALTHYLDGIASDLTLLSKNPTTIESVINLTDSWQELGDEASDYLRTHYIKKNPYPLDQKHKLHDAQDRSRYSFYHKQVHDYFIQYVHLKSYYDLFLFDAEGNLLYTVAKENDFATNILNGEWDNTHLSHVYNKALEQSKFEYPSFEDFAFYKPSNNLPASFIALPIINNNKRIGVIAFQMPTERINKIMQVTAGMGESGETYLVGEDKLMRSDSRFLNSSSILSTKVETSATIDAFNGTSTVDIIKDYRGIEVYSAFTTINVFGETWAILSEIDSEEVMRPVQAMKNLIIFSAFIIVCIIFFFGYLLAINIAKPIVTMTETMNKLANNELSVDVAVTNRQDEIGFMANALVVFKKNAVERAQYQENLEFVATHDVLTGLVTREYAIKELDNLMEKCLQLEQNLALFFIDLNRFKLVNDTLGHQEGDHLLKNISHLLIRSVRSIDIVARIGGDEFIVIVPFLDKNSKEHENISNRILRDVNIPYPSVKEGFCVSVSIGVALFPDDETSPTELIKKADQAMYEHKASNHKCS